MLLSTSIHDPVTFLVGSSGNLGSMTLLPALERPQRSQGFRPSPAVMTCRMVGLIPRLAPAIAPSLGPVGAPRKIVMIAASEEPRPARYAVVWAKGRSKGRESGKATVAVWSYAA